jgi:hypothetical protein
MATFRLFRVIPVGAWFFSLPPVAHSSGGATVDLFVRLPFWLWRVCLLPRRVASPVTHARWYQCRIE